MISHYLFDDIVSVLTYFSEAAGDPRRRGGVRLIFHFHEFYFQCRAPRVEGLNHTLSEGW